MVHKNFYTIKDIAEYSKELGFITTERTIQRHLQGQSIGKRGNSKLYSSQTVRHFVQKLGPDGTKQLSPEQVKQEQDRIEVALSELHGEKYQGADKRVQSVVSNLSKQFMLEAIFYDGARPHRIDLQSLKNDLATMFEWSDDMEADKEMPPEIIRTSERLKEWTSYVSIENMPISKPK